MENVWSKSFNLAKVPEGTERSILGYAGESLVIGRALICGYNLFFKAWRDSKYDAVLDHLGILYRIEIKQSRDGKNFSLTSGARSGKQISRSAKSREQIVSSKDCDFLIAVHSLSGTCWVVPIEVIEILNKKKLSSLALSSFKEAWAIFALVPTLLDQLGVPGRLMGRDIDELIAIAAKIGLKGDLPISLEIGKRTVVTLDSDVERYVFAIWVKIAEIAQKM